mgnify:CR=1 FL=1
MKKHITKIISTQRDRKRIVRESKIVRCNLIFEILTWSAWLKKFDLQTNLYRRLHNWNLHDILLVFRFMK